MNPKEIQKKINSYAHSEFNNNKYKDLGRIKKMIDSRLDLYSRPISYDLVKFDKTFPEYIYNNKDKFKNWIV